MPRLVEAMQEQAPSRFLQHNFASFNDDQKSQIFAALLPETLKLSEDAFGNWVVQKLLEEGTEEQRSALATELVKGVIKLSEHRFGCRVIQTVIQVLPQGEAQDHFVEDLKDKVETVAENMHGNHVIQMCIKYMPTERLGFIVDAIARRPDFYAGHQYGCRIIQRLLEKGPLEQQADLLGRITESAGKLARDKHGNYVVQCILEKGRPEDKQKIIGAISQDVLAFSKNKVSSNVVEKCFEAATKGPDSDALQAERAELFRAMLGDGGADSPLQQLMHDRFGNYTVQCVIRHSRGSDLELLKQRILALEPELKGSATGRHILAALKKEIDEGGD
jgi:hypothetical protein